MQQNKEVGNVTDGNSDIGYDGFIIIGMRDHGRFSE